MSTDVAKVVADANAVNINPGDAERALRSRGRAERLKQALRGEESKATPRAARIEALKESIEDEGVTLAFLLRKIKKQQRV